EKLCAKCSLAPVCLPEEARLGDGATGRPGDGERREAEGLSPRRPVVPSPSRKPLRLFPADDDRQSLHVVAQGARIGRKGDRLEITQPDELPELYPVNEVGQVVLHGFAQITTQALGFCSQNDIGVHWLTYGGRYLGAWSAGAGSVQRRIRQYKALTDSDFCLSLAIRLAEARARGQLSHLLRASRDAGRGPIETVIDAIAMIRRLLGPMSRARSIHSLRGYEGSVGAQYFKALPHAI